MAYASELSEQAHIIRKFHSSDCRGRSRTLTCGKYYDKSKAFQESRIGAAWLRNYLSRLSVSRINSIVRICLNNRIIELRFFRAFCVNLVLFFPCELIRHIDFIILNSRHIKHFTSSFIQSILALKPLLLFIL